MDRKQPGDARYPLDRRRIIVALGVAAAVLVAAVVGAAVTLRAGGGGDSAPPGDRAVIVDQLALTDPNPAFIADARRSLEAAGYKVDYVPAEAVTVDFYRDLPARGYRFIVLRSHTSDFAGSLDPKEAALSTPIASTGLFTNEVYSTSTHVSDQRATRLMVDSYVDRGIPWKYFGITPEFLLQSARGRFDGTTIVLMGCSGLKTDDLAQAFMTRGAKEFVSWDQPVTAEHTDAATRELLANLFDHRLALADAVSKTMTDVGPDPAYGAKLELYP
jgi:hypothetical protein